MLKLDSAQRSQRTHHHSLHFKSALKSFSLLASSSFLKSLVFCARSFLCVRVSLWCETMSEATVSSWGMSVVRSMSGALSAYANAVYKKLLLLHAPIAFWNLLPSCSSATGVWLSTAGGVSTVSSMSTPPSIVARQMVQTCD